MIFDLNVVMYIVSIVYTIYPAYKAMLYIF